MKKYKIKYKYKNKNINTHGMINIDWNDIIYAENSQIAIGLAKDIICEKIINSGNYNGIEVDSYSIYKLNKKQEKYIQYTGFEAIEHIEKINKDEGNNCKYQTI